MSSLRVAGFVLRTPLLPLADLMALADEDRGAVRARLRVLTSRPEVRDAIFVAAPALDAALERWLESGGDRDKTEAALYRYVARMTGRPTPLGLCAGCSTGEIAAESRLALGGSQRDAPHSRLDMHLVFALVEALDADPEVRPHLVYRPNPGLYTVAGRLRYVEAVTTVTGRVCRLVAADADAPVAAALERSRGGATRAQLASAVASDGAGAAEAERFVDELIDAQLLVSDLALAVIGPEPVPLLAARLRQIPAAAGVASLLEHAVGQLAAADRAPPGRRGPRLRALARRLEELPVATDVARLFQVDLVRAPAAAALPVGVLEALRHGVEILRRLPPRPGPPELVRLRERFAARYDARTVPLAEALDPDIGVGLDGAPDSSPPSPEPEVSPAVEQMLLRLAGESAGRGQLEVQLGRRELALLDDQPAQPLPDAFAVVAAVAAESDAAAGRGEFQVRLIGASGPSGARLLGRFCHADPQLRELVAAHLAHEEALRPDAVFAEIAHLPEGRIGNVLARPRLREYEIALLAGSSAPDDHRLLLEDLTVSLEDDRFVLRSRRLGKEVVPRLTSAHNYLGGGIGLYRFLALLQEQDGASLGWSWGAIAGLPFTPRVRCGRVVLAPARWTVHEDEVAALDTGTDAGRLAAVRAWRAERGLPRLVGLEAHDAPLPVDLENPLGIDLLLRELRRNAPLVLVELWPGPDELAVRGPGGRYVHELIVPMARAAVPAAPAERPPRRPRPARRSFPPGTEWLYAKLYTGRALADRLLVEEVAPLVEAARAEGADAWHFLRYADPEFHLRLRLRAAPAVLQGRVLPLLTDTAARLVDDGLVWRVQLDTYERELERYGGGAAIDLVEQAFDADSDAVLALLAALPPDEHAAADRWLAAVPGAFVLARDLLGGEAPARELMARLRAAPAAADEARHERRALARRLRAVRPRLEPLLDRALADEPGEELPWAALARRSQRLVPVGAELAALDGGGELGRPLEEVVGSLVHMHVNRLLRSAADHERAVYDAAERFAAGRAARAARMAVETP